jgi:hypothetical protein
MVSPRFPDAKVQVDADRILRAVARQVARNYASWAGRVSTTAAALMPVTELAADLDQLAELTAVGLDPSDAEHWRRHAKKRGDRAFSAVFRLPNRLEDTFPDRSLRSMVDPGAYLAIPSLEEYNALVDKASSAAAHPFEPPNAAAAQKPGNRRRRAMKIPGE